MLVFFSSSISFVSFKAASFSKASYFVCYSIIFWL